MSAKIQIDQPPNSTRQLLFSRRSCALQAQLDDGMTVTTNERVATDELDGGDETAPVERWIWLRCPNCQNGLWRAYKDHAEMPVSLRGGQKRVIRVPLEGMGWLSVVCEKCGVKWTHSKISEEVPLEGVVCEQCGAAK